jgi:hypothetical protein
MYLKSHVLFTQKKLPHTKRDSQSQSVHMKLYKKTFQRATKGVPYNNRKVHTCMVRFSSLVIVHNFSARKWPENLILMWR